MLAHATEHWLRMGGLTSMAVLEAWHTAAVDRDTLLNPIRARLAKLVRRWPQSMPPGWVQALQLQQSMYSSARVEREAASMQAVSHACSAPGGQRAQIGLLGIALCSSQPLL